MPILSIDPGITTGYCLVGVDGLIIESGNLQPEDLPESILVSYSKDTELRVVLEDTPIPTHSQMNQRLLEVKNFLLNLFPHATQVLPGVWKTNLSIANLSLPKDREMTQHEKDAYRLAMWYFILPGETKR